MGSNPIGVTCGCPAPVSRVWNPPAKPGGFSIVVRTWVCGPRSEEGVHLGAGYAHGSGGGRGGAAGGDELGEDADGDFGRSDGADVEADGGVNALQCFARDAGAAEVVEDCEDLS